MAIAAMRVPTIFTAVDRFSDVVSKMTAKTARFGATAEASAMRTSRAFNSAGTKMLGAGIGIAIGIGFAVNEVGKFEKSIASVSTLTNNTPAEMNKIGDSILNMSKKIPVAMSDLTSGMYDVVSAGIIGTANQLQVLDSSARLAVAGLGTVKEAVNITTSSLNAFGIEASESDRVTNMLMKTVKYGKTTVSGISESFGAFASIMKNSNVSLEEYLAATATLTTTGMSASRAQTQFSSATMALIKPNKTMAKLLQSMGAKDIPTFIKQNGGVVKTLGLVTEKASKMKLRLGEILGRKEGLSATLSLLGAQKDKFKEVMDDMVGGADNMNVAFAKQQATLAAKIQLMKNNLTVLAIRIGDILIPRIKDLVDSVVPTIEKFGQWADQNRGFANTLMTLAKWLLIIGFVAKVGAALFYGLSKIFAICTFISETYAAATGLVAAAQLAQAFSGASLTAVMWGLAGSLLAVYWPVLLILGVLGLLTYSMFKSIGSTENMVSKQTLALDKGNAAWKKSTDVMAKELEKQRNLKNPPKAAILPEQKKMDQILSANASQKSFTFNKDKSGNTINSPINQSIAKRLFENRQMDATLGKDKASTLRSNGFTFDEFKKLHPEVASYEQRAQTDKKQEITLNLTAPRGYGLDVVGTPPSGIKVVTKSNQGSRD